MVDREETANELERRRYIKMLSAGAAAGLAGCAGGGGGSTPTEEPSGSDGSDGSGSGGGTQAQQWDEQLEVLHGWAGGDGEKAITALTDAFKEEYPEMDTAFQAIGASANVALNTKVLTRMVNQNPPSSFANWPGKNLNRYKGHLMDMESSVWEAAGLKDVMQERAMELCTFNGKMSAVPLGSHRMNNLFFRKDAMEQAGVDPSSLDSVDAMLSAFDKIESETDMAPMAQAMKGPWTVLQLWAQVFTSMAGVDAYMEFINGNGDKQKMIAALEKVKEIQQNYITSDASSISFTQAGQAVISGDAATIHQGNWVYGMFRADDEFNYQEQWDWIPFPGTEGIYFYHVDAIVAPANNPSKDETIAWQKFVGSKEAQITFNNPKGSVPLRTDIDPSELTDFLAMTYKDLKDSERYPPTIAHGLAVKPEQMGNCKKAMSNHMMGPYDVEKAATNLKKAVSS